jgi:4-alpha-glucanotransferase
VNIEDVGIPAEHRAGGILLHPTCLPGPYGIGDLGPAARRWIEWLAGSGCRLWQVLPLGPIGYGNSPYQGLSAFAGNHLLISPELLVAEGLISQAEIARPPDFPGGSVDYALVTSWKEGLLASAAKAYFRGAAPYLRDAFSRFCQVNENWLDDYALYRVSKRKHEGRPWSSWEAPLARREPQALDKARKQWADELAVERFTQFLFFHQWQAVRQEAHSSGIAIIGDLPIFLGHDSSDVWSHPEMFLLDDAFKPVVVAGVPPDYFSPTGQRWGNPLYSWPALRQSGYQWWIHRFRSMLETVDVVRMDHFRGYVAAWQIPAECPTAQVGEWVPTPGAELLAALQNALGKIPAIAEDLGVITPDVVALMEAFNLPGMKVLQFGFEGGPDNSALPHHYQRKCVAYTGTHDNNTSRAWFDSLPDEIRRFCSRYLGKHEGSIAWGMVRAIWSSVANWAIAPLQDFLGLGEEARFNLPGTIWGNWEWRLEPDQLTMEMARKIRELNYVFGRRHK